MVTGASLILQPGPASHVTRVLRMQTGESLRAFNGHGGEFDANIESIRRDAVTLRIGTHQTIERESPLHITLLQGIARGEKMDLILQKATELGVAAVVPVTTARSTVRLDEEAAHRKHAHWLGVLIGACEQCGRNRIPTIAAPSGLATVVGGSQAQLKLLLEPEPEAGALRTLLARVLRSEAQHLSVCMLVGPEGGLDPHEVLSAKQAGFLPCRLGPRVLRTETAALTALAALQVLAGDLT